MRISDWSSDVCSSDLRSGVAAGVVGAGRGLAVVEPGRLRQLPEHVGHRRCATEVDLLLAERGHRERGLGVDAADEAAGDGDGIEVADVGAFRSEEHTSELQSLMRISYAVFCLTTKKIR